MIAKVLLGALIAWMACVAQAQPAHHYEYVLYMRGGSPSDAVARVRAALPSRLLQHRLSDPAGVRGWDGKGAIPLAIEARSLNGKSIDDAEVFDSSGETLREVLKVPAPQPVSAVAVMVGVPASGNIAAYVEALRLTVDAANAAPAPVFLDGETGETRRRISLAEGLEFGRRRNGGPVSASNPPRLTIMEGITAFKKLPGGGLRTLGLRKLGLPDLVMAEWVPGRDPLWVIETVGNLMLSGKASAVPGSTFMVRAGDPELVDALHGDAPVGALASLRFAAAPLSTPHLLQLEFPGAAGTHVYERQTLFTDTFIPSPYLPLGAGPARELSMAVARVRSRVPDLRARYASLRARGTRVFVGMRMDLAVKEMAVPRKTDGVRWDEVVTWAPDGSITLRRWTGDPRAGGAAMRYTPPIKVGDTEFAYEDSDVGDDVVEDVLLIERDGRSSGGEVTELLKRLIKDAKARTSTPRS